MLTAALIVRADQAAVPRRMYSTSADDEKTADFKLWFLIGVADKHISMTSCNKMMLHNARFHLLTYTLAD